MFGRKRKLTAKEYAAFRAAVQKQMRETKRIPIRDYDAESNAYSLLY